MTGQLDLCIYERATRRASRAANTTTTAPANLPSQRSTLQHAPILRLSNDLVYYIADFLSRADQASWQLTCRGFYYIIPFPALTKRDEILLLQAEARDREDSVWFCFWCARLHPKRKSWVHPSLVGPTGPWLWQDQHYDMALPTFWPDLDPRAVQASLYSQLYNSDKGPRLSDLSRTDVDIIYQDLMGGNPHRDEVAARLIDGNLMIWQKSMLVADTTWDLVQAIRRQGPLRICPHLGMMPSFNLARSVVEVEAQRTIRGRSIYWMHQAASCDLCYSDFCCRITSLSNKRYIVTETYHLLGDTEEPFFAWNYEAGTWVAGKRDWGKYPPGGIKMLWMGTI